MIYHLAFVLVGGSEAGIMAKYNALDNRGVVQCLYVWIDGSGQKLRCKVKATLSC